MATKSKRNALLALVAILIAAATLPTTASAVLSRVPQPYSPIDGSGIGAPFSFPSPLAVDESTGNVFLNDGPGEEIPPGVEIFSSTGQAPAGLTSPYQIDGAFKFESGPISGDANDIAIDNSATSPSRGSVYVVTAQDDKVKRFVFNTSTGRYEQSGELIASPPLDNPTAVAVDPKGDVFVGAGSRIVKFSPAGTKLASYSVFKSPPILAQNAGELAIDSSGDVFVRSNGSHSIVELPAGPSGEIDPTVFNEVHLHVPPPDPPGFNYGGMTLSRPSDIDVDIVANKLFIALGTHVVQYDATTLTKELEFGRGMITTEFQGGFRYINGGTNGLAVNPATGTVYVSDKYSNAVHAFGPPVIVPGITLKPAAPIGATKATVNAAIKPDGLEVTDCVVEYGPEPKGSTTEIYEATVPCEGSIPVDSSDHPVKAELSGLSPDTVYHFRVRATNSNGSNYSADELFRTSAPAVTGGATEVTGTKATLNGIVSPAGEAVSQCFFEYGTTTSYGSNAPCAESVPTDEGEHSVSAALTHLAPNGQTYHFRLVIVGGSGEVTGNDQTFATKDTVVTKSASNLSPDAATLNGTLNPEGIPYTECTFEWGTTTAYGSTAPCAETPAQIGTGEAPVAVHADISGLSPNTTYHYRLLGTNADGTAEGKDEAFSTLGKPDLVAEWPEEVGLEEATLFAQVNPEGVSTTYRFEWGTDTSYGNSSGEFEVGVDQSVHTVSFFLDDLEPGTAYHWRAVASNEIGTEVGPDRVITTFKPAALETGCPNQAFRTGPSARLADCRAYEMVSPLEKNGGDVQALPEPINTYSMYTSYKQASLDGEKVTYTAGVAFADAISGPFASQYIASRGSEGWSTHGISPPRGVAVFEGQGKTPDVNWDAESPFDGFTDDLCSAWVRDTNTEPLTADGLVGYVNLYRRANCDEERFEALSNQGPFGAANEYLNHFATASGGAGPGLRFQGASEDLSHQVFISGAALTPDAVPGTNSQLYDLHDGKLELVSVLPSGEANPGNSAVGMLGNPIENRESTLEHAVSEDGSRIFWTSDNNSLTGGPGKLYVRVDGAATLPVSETVSPADASYWAAAADGSSVLFTVGDSLYEFDVDKALAEETEPARLVAQQAVGVLGAADDLSRIYFVSREGLAPGATSGENNLYLEEEGSLTFIAELSGADVVTDGGILMSPIYPDPVLHASRITPDGHYIAFQALGALTGYDNVDPVSGKRYTEVYRYDANTAELVCISCNPTGARPVGNAIPYPFDVQKKTFEGELEDTPTNEIFAAASLLPTCEREQHCSRVLSSDGSRIYFHSNEALVIGDTNGVKDVYQWEAPDTGSCDVEDPGYYAQNGGCLSLISTGTSPQESEFVDASADGSDVFISTTSGIDPRDEGLIDVYDARVGGGFELPSTPPGCEGEACQSPPEPPNDPTPASSSFQGAGNVAGAPKTRSCPRGKRRVARRGTVRCVKKSRGDKRRASHKGRASR